MDALVVSNWFGLDKVRQRLAETSLQNESRDDVVRDALNAIQERPLPVLAMARFTPLSPLTIKAKWRFL